MTNPFELLKIPESAGDDEIRAAYLARVREYPPERAPEQFQAIRAAYDRIKTEKARIAHLYIDPPEVDNNEVLNLLLRADQPGRPNPQQFQNLFADSLQQIIRSDSAEN